MNVAIIGCGPAGLAAAHAAVGLGYGVSIFSPKNRSPLRGPLLLQRPIPGVTTTHPDAYIKQIVVGGTILDYRYKLYGDINIAINGDILEDGYHAWRMEETYERLWQLYSSRITDVAITPERLNDMANSGLWALVVSTAPADGLCLRPGECSFISASVSLVEHMSYPNQPDNTIVFNADPDVPWARSSVIFGHESTEWPAGTLDMPIGSKPITLRKPISTDCSCHPKVMRTGRFGAWRNETWVDTAYNDVRRALVHMDNAEIWGAVK